MMEYIWVIIGKVRTREREKRERMKLGRSDRSITTWTAVEGPQLWGRS